MKTKKSFFMLALILPAILLAQIGPVASGGEASGTTGNVSFSVGQIDYVNASSTNHSLNQGLQQPFEWFELTGLELNTISLQFSAFPNPSSEFIYLSVENYDLNEMEYSLHAVDGKLLVHPTPLSSTLTQISLSTYAKGNYLISVSKTKKLIKTFNIIKN